jgi:nitric oxide reductase large subunit
MAMTISGAFNGFTRLPAFLTAVPHVSSEVMVAVAVTIVMKVPPCLHHLVSMSCSIIWSRCVLTVEVFLRGEV